MQSDTITHDADWVTLEGEARGFWGGWVGFYPTISIEGWTGGVKLKQTVTGKNGITVGTNFQGTTRHQGLGIRNLYLFGYQQTGIAISDANNTDISEITNCVIHNYSKGVNVAWDTPLISGNSIQSIASDAITLSFNYGSIVKNICFDIGGSAVVLSSSGTQVVGNTFGSLGLSSASGIVITGKSNTVTGNTVQGIRGTGSIVEINGGVDNSICGNTLSMSFNTQLTQTNDTTGHGVYLHASAINNAITGNTINNANASASGYAVCLGTSGDTTITGCTVVGNVITGGKWNAASTTTILDSSGGTTNKVGMNAGDAKLVGSQ
jgi:hypothetical protein